MDKTEEKMIDQSQALPVSDPEATFYTVSNARYFLGTVGLLNSLRLTGHHNDLVVLDCGLTSSQREHLSYHCKLVDAPGYLATNPTLFKPFPHLLNPTGVVVIIDSDMIVTRSLKEIITLANHGRICAFPDPDSSRWFNEWQQLFALRSKLRHQTYVNAGFVAFSMSHWPDFLGQWWEACKRILSHPTLTEGAPNSAPSSQADQDALNALLMSGMSTEVLALQPEEEAPMAEALKRGVQIVDAQTLSCTYREHATTLLHGTNNPKPWEPQAWSSVWQNAYVRLLHRSLTGTDVALRVPTEELPLWLRTGILANLSIRSLHALNAPTQHPILRRVRWRIWRPLKQVLLKLYSN